MSKQQWKALGLVVLIAAFAVPVFRSGLRTNLTLFEFMKAHTVFGPEVQFVPEEKYIQQVGG